MQFFKLQGVPTNFGLMLDILKIWCHFESVLRLFWGYSGSLMSFEVNDVIWGHLNYVLWPLRSFETIEDICGHWNYFWPLRSFKTSVHNLLGHPVDWKTLYFIACFFYISWWWSLLSPAWLLLVSMQCHPTLKKLLIAVCFWGNS